MFSVGATLEQDGNQVAYLSHHLTDTEMHWCVGDMELFEFMIELKVWMST